jgi:hypothetical protein
VDVATKPKTDNIVQIFGHDEEDEEFEVVLAPRASRMERSVASVSPIDLAGKPKLLFMVGRGGTGKTTLARWLGWRMAEQGRETLLAALDPQNRSLVGWFTGVAQPADGSVYETSKFLKQLIDDRIAQRAGAILDFGGGDTSLTRLVESHRDVCDMLVDAGVEPVGVYTVGTGVDDLAAMLLAEREGFLPRARMIVLNEARAPLGTPRETAFRALMRSKAYQAAIQGGTMPIWMPALDAEVAADIERRRLTFGMARDGQVRDGMKSPPIGGLDRVGVGRWLRAMEEDFAPVATWLP